jgi:AraC-like DNA-binding protein
MIRSDVGKPRGVLHRATMNDDRFDHLRRAPSPALREHVAHFWIVRWDLRGCPPFVAETLPHPSVHVTIEARRAEVGGVSTGKFSRRLTGQGRVFGVKFRPGAFQPLVGGSMARWTNRVRSVASVFGSDGTRWVRAVRAEDDVERCIAITEELLLRDRLPPLAPMVARIRDLVERLAVDRELLRVEQVAELAGIEPRRLQRLFRQYVGVTPKWVIQRYRLHEAAERLIDFKPGTLAALAQSLGYFDQAHFIRDFKAVVGRSPGER